MTAVKKPLSKIISYVFYNIAAQNALLIYTRSHMLVISHLP